jgi:hypothetical protein
MQMRRGINTNRLSAIMCMLLGFAGCTPMRSATDFDRSINFAMYQTFAWMPPPAQPSPTRTAYDDLVALWIRQHVVQHLTAKGLRKDTTGQPDLRVAFTFGLADKHDVYRTYDTYFYKRQGYYNRWSALGSVTVERIEERKYTENTITIGMFDPYRNRIVWYGGTTTEVRSPKEDEAIIEKSVSRILAKFPPQPIRPDALNMAVP